MKIGLVSPYVYPLPGRRHPARPLPLREPPAARPRRPDPHQQPRPPARVRGRRHPDRQGLLAAGQRLGRDDHRSRRGSCRRSATCSSASSSTCSTSTSRSCRSCRSIVLAALDERERRDLPRLRRLLAVVRVRQPGDEARRSAGSTAGSRSAARPSTSSTATSRATTRSSRTASTSTGSSGPCRSRAGRTARGTSCSSAGSSRARACSTCSRPTGSCARPAATAGSSSSATGPQEREARRYVATRRLGGVEFLGRVSDDEKAAAVPDRRRLRLAGDRRRVVRDRPARGDGRRARRSSRRDIHGYKGVVRRGREALLVPPREPKADRRARVARLLRDDELREPDGAGPASRGPRSSAGSG